MNKPAFPNFLFHIDMIIVSLVAILRNWVCDNWVYQFLIGVSTPIESQTGKLEKKHWQSGEVRGVERQGCILQSAANNLADLKNWGPQITQGLKSLLGREHFGLVPPIVPGIVECACALCTPTSPLLKTLPEIRTTVFYPVQNSEEDKRATTNVQYGLVFFFAFSVILFYSLLFSFILFYSLLFSFILFYSLLFSFILFYALLNLRKSPEGIVLKHFEKV